MMKKVSMIATAMLFAVVLFLMIGNVESHAEDIPFVQATSRDALQQAPSDKNNGEMIVTLQYPNKGTGAYRQAVKVVLKNRDNGQSWYYYQEQYVIVKTDGPVPSWQVHTLFSQLEPGNYTVELYSLGSLTDEKQMIYCDFAVAGSHHSCNFENRITQLGTSNRDTQVRRICTACGKYNGENSTESAYAIYEKECRYRIDAATEGATVNLYHPTWNSYTKKMMQKIASRRDITVCIYFVYNGLNYKVTIPANTAVNLDYDYYGPLLLAQLYGFEQVAYNPSAVTKQTSLVEKIAGAKPGDTVVLTGKDTYTQTDMVAIAARRDITVILQVTYQGVKYNITIPANAAVDTSIQYYGPLKLASLYPFALAQ